MRDRRLSDAGRVRGPAQGPKLSKWAVYHVRVVLRDIPERSRLNAPRVEEIERIVRVAVERDTDAVAVEVAATRTDL